MNSDFYYNIKLNIYDLDKTQIIKYDFNSERSILKKASDWEVAVERCYIPTKNIPIFFFKDNSYKIGIWWENNDKTIKIYKDEYIKYNYVIEPEYDFALLGFKPIWNLYDFTNAINDAIILCIEYIEAQPNFDNNYTLTGITDYEPKSFYPKFDFNRQSDNNQQFISMSGQFFSVKNWQIFMNDGLFNFFNGFSNEYSNPPFFNDLNWRILKSYSYTSESIFKIENTHNDIKYMYKIYTEFSTIGIWNILHSILIDTTLPISTEITNNFNTTKSSRIITDFVPVEQLNNRSAIQYFNQGNLRFYEFFSDLPLFNINLKLYWEDKEKRIWNYIMSKDEFFSLKLHFRRKKFIKDLSRIKYNNLLKNNIHLKHKDNHIINDDKKDDIYDVNNNI